MPFKYNLVSLKERFMLSAAEIESFINAGMLIPDGWGEKNYKDQSRITRDGFASQIWSAAEVERFERIANMVKDRHLHFYHLVNTRINEIDAGIRDQFEKLYLVIHKLKYDFNKLSARLERKEIMIDLDYFSGITGISKQTFYNTRTYLDSEKLICRLSSGVYKDLLWYKIKNIWQTPLIGFEDIRSGFSYELWLDEKKRRGEFIPAINASVEEILKLEKKLK